MKNKTHYIIISLLLIRCNGPESTLPTLDGEYQATFKVEYNSGDAYMNPVTLMFSGKNFSSTSGSGRIPAGGSGTFQITEGYVTFTDINFWTAEFDWNLILNGEYAFSESDTEIILRKELKNYGTYTYRLIKYVK